MMNKRGLMITRRKSFRYRNTIKYCFLLTVFVFITSVPSWAANSLVGHIITLEGSVRIARAGQIGAISAKIGDELFIGDSIQTNKNSKSQIMLDDNTIIYVGEKSNLQLKTYHLNHDREKRDVIIKAISGKLRFIVSKIFKVSNSGMQRSWRNSNFRIETPTAVAGIKGTDFIITVSKTHTTFVVFEGLIGAKNRSPFIREEILVGTNQASTIKEGMAPKPLIVISPQQKQILMQDIMPTIVAQEQGKGTVQVAEIVRDIAAGISTKEIIEKVVEMGMNVDEVVRVIIRAGVDPGRAVYTAIQEGYMIVLVVSGALDNMQALPTVINAAFAAGADANAIMEGAKEAGIVPELIATAIAEARSFNAPVFPFTSAVIPAPVVEVYIAPSNIVLIGGGITQSTQIASPSAP